MSNCHFCTKLIMSHQSKMDIYLLKVVISKYILWVNTTTTLVISKNLIKSTKSYNY